MILNFGKYSGKSISEVDDSYLIWGAKNLNKLELKAAFQNELQRRTKMTQLTPTIGSKYDPLIFGKDDTENIVATEVEDGKVTLFIERDGEIKQETRDNKLWLLCDKQYSSKLSRLEGNNRYKWIAYFDTYQDFQQVKSVLKKKNREGYDPTNVDNDKFLTINILKNDLGEPGSFDFHWNGKRGEISELNQIEMEHLHKLRAKLESEKDEDDW